MKAAILTKYGPPEVFKIREVGKLVPKDNEVLIRVRATSVNFGDLIARNFRAVTPRQFNMTFLFWLIAKITFGLKKPNVKILGSEVAGVIEAVGKGVTRFKIGQEIFGYPAQSFGAYAEYMCMPETGMIATKPSNVSFEEAAVAPYGALVALNLLRKARIKKGQNILINGASGSIGAAAVGIAKYYGATVTGVCGTERVKYVEQLGADKVIDYTKHDFTESEEKYDLILDILGKGSYTKCRKVLKREGTLLFASFKFKQLLLMLWTSLWGGKRVICTLSGDNPADLEIIKELIEKGKIKIIIDKVFPLERVAEAHRYMESGGRKSKVAIRVSTEKKAKKR